MQLIIILGLIAKLALVSCDCDVGKTVQDFDITEVSSSCIKQFFVIKFILWCVQKHCQ